MTFTRPLPLFLIALAFGVASPLQADEAFKSQLAKLSDDQYAVRMEAKKALIGLCGKQPELVDALIRLYLDPKADPEQAFISKEIIRKTFEESVFVERGAIGFALNRELIVERLEKDQPAANSGIQIGSQLLSVAGKSVAGKQPSEIYAMIHATRPGTKLEMEFVDRDGEKLLYHPEVAPRSTIRSDENVEERKKEAYTKWIAGKLEKLQSQED